MIYRLALLGVGRPSLSCYSKCSLLPGMVSGGLGGLVSEEKAPLFSWPKKPYFLSIPNDQFNQELTQNAFTVSELTNSSLTG